ncbi:MAG: hypothetical protein WCG75_05065, partial [Armatimonadota bacterium]
MTLLAVAFGIVLASNPRHFSPSIRSGTKQSFTSASKGVIGDYDSEPRLPNGRVDIDTLLA